MRATRSCRVLTDREVTLLKNAFCVSNEARRLNGVCSDSGTLGPSQLR
jgi:hypothetical protein